MISQIHSTEKTTVDLKLLLKNAIAIYKYGSAVYGTFVDGISDEDYIVIIPNSFSHCDGEQLVDANAQYSFYTVHTWQLMLDNNAVCAMECYFLPKQFVVKETAKFHTNICKEKVRKEFSSTASNSFVKCKKKLTVADSFNPRIGKKSLWHSLRILDFGIQILEHGQIVNYSSANYLYDGIVNADSNDWKYFQELYKPIYNSFKSKFRNI